MKLPALHGAARRGVDPSFTTCYFPSYAHTTHSNNIHHSFFIHFSCEFFVCHLMWSLCGDVAKNKKKNKNQSQGKLKNFHQRTTLDKIINLMCVSLLLCLVCVHFLKFKIYQQLFALPAKNCPNKTKSSLHFWIHRKLVASSTDSMYAKKSRLVVILSYQVFVTLCWLQSKF